MRESPVRPVASGLLALLCSLIVASPAFALPFLGIIEPEYPSTDEITVMRINLRARGDRVKGRIINCRELPACAAADPAPPDCDTPRSCPVRGARIVMDIDESVFDRESRQTVVYLSGEVRLPKGSTCTIEGDAWTARVRGKKKPRGVFQGISTCPPGSGVAGTARFLFWVKGYEPPFGEF